MKKEDKELLLKDLCARLPYGTLIYAQNDIDWYESEICTQVLSDVINDEYVVKPYLFPLSSMTEEQWNNGSRVNLTEFTFESFKCGCATIASYTCDNDLHDLVEFINWLIENHFDVNGLIEKGLAIDATGLNIY